jgi:hypothetical protein
MSEIQVVLLNPLQEPFKRWLDERGLQLFQIPLPEGSDDLPTYAVSMKDDN